MDDATDHFRSDQALMDQTLDRDKQLQEHDVSAMLQNACAMLKMLNSDEQQVKSWLQDRAPDFATVEKRMGGWLHTRRHVQNQRTIRSGVLGPRGNSNIVDALDPDAPNRQRKSLAPEDQV